MLYGGECARRAQAMPGYAAATVHGDVREFSERLGRDVAWKPFEGNQRERSGDLDARSTGTSRGHDRSC